MSPLRSTISTSPDSDSHSHPVAQEFFGHPLQPKDPAHFRLLTQNVNGFPSSPSTLDKLVSTLHILDTFQTDVACFQEHNLDTTKFAVKDSIYQAFHRLAGVPKPSSIFSSSDIETNTPFKPGGTSIVNFTCHHRRTAKTFDDPYGRWSGLQFRQHNNRHLVILSIYQTCANPTNAVGITAHHQQQAMLSNADRSDTPRQAFLADLTDTLSTLQAEGNSIILAGDFNATMTATNSPIHRLMAQANLVDAWTHIYPDSTEFGSHARGSRRIDHVLVTPDLLTSIRAIGFLPFDEVVDSDHRALYIDFEFAGLFGPTSSRTHEDMSRSVTSSDKQSVLTFVNQVYSHLLAHNIFQRCAQLSSVDPAQAPATLEAIDYRITEAFHTGMRKARHRRPEWFSIPIVRQRLLVAALRNHATCLRKHRQSSASLRRRMEKLGISIDLPVTLEDTITRLHQERTKLTQMSKNSQQLRLAELQAKINNADILDDQALSSAIQAIKNSEERQQTYRTLKAVRGKGHGAQATAFDQLAIPADWPRPDELAAYAHQGRLTDPKSIQSQPHLWRIITDPQDIQLYLRMRNQLHFGQARSTPLPQMEEDLDWNASTDFASRILSGQANFQSTDTLSEMLQECKQSISNPDSQPYVTYDDFKGKIMKWRERTTTSPSGRHLGCFKALFVQITHQPPSSNPDSSTASKDSPTFTDQQRAIVDCIVSVLNACIQFCHPLDRWLTIVNTMIYKEQGNIQIHRLRIIHIYESDFNFLLATQWRKALWRALSHPDLSEFQFGGRPGCESTSLSLLEELQYDVVRVTRRMFIQFSNDAASCYDRIIVSLASLINKKFGIPEEIVHLHAQTLRHARFHIKTAAGTSQIHYSHDSKFPIYGTGQGSGNSPVIWLFISAVLLNVHRRLSHGAQFVCPNGTHAVDMSLIGFVDDTNGFVAPFQPQDQVPLSEAVAQMQADAQLWSDLLYCSGGKLEPTKCMYLIIHFGFTTDGAPYMEYAPEHHPIRLLDQESNSTIPITAMRPRGNHKTLGHYKSPLDAQKAQFDALMIKASALSRDISCSPISRYGAWVSYTTVYIPSITFVLPQSYFSPQQLARLEARTMEAIFAKCGFHRKTRRSILFSPRELGGGGFIRLYTFQGAGQLMHFVKHWRTTTVISSMLRIDLSWSQFQSGTSRSILDDTTTPLPHLECQWLASLRTFLNHLNGSIKLDESFVPAPSRLNDVPIMQLAIDLDLFQPNQLKIFNYCRLLTHTYYLSDLFLADGATICPFIQDCTRPPWFDPSTPIILQQRPSARAIRRTWLKFLSVVQSHHPHFTTVPSLGPWLRTSAHLRLRRQTYQSLEDPQLIIHWDDNGYSLYKQNTTFTQYYHRIGTALSSQLSADWTLIHIRRSCSRRQQSSVHILTHPNVVYRPPPRINISLFFEDLIPSFPQWQQPLLSSVVLHPDIYQLSVLPQLYPNATLFLVSDGSVGDTGCMTYGWVYGLSTGLRLAEGFGQAFGTPSSYRAEAYGILSAGVFLQNFLQFMKLESTLLPHVVISDNESAILALQERRQYALPFPNATLATDWDVIEAAHQTHATMLATTRSTYRWIRGHQDQTTDYAALPVEAQMNVDADELTHSEISLLPANHIHFLPHARCLLLGPSRPITGHYLREISFLLGMHDFRCYLTSKLQLSASLQDRLDLVFLRQLIKKIKTPHYQKVKMLFDLLPTRHHCRKFKLGTTACFHCQSSPETFLHLIQCQNSISSAFRDRTLSQLQQLLSKPSVPSIVRTILYTIFDDIFHARPVLASLLLEPLYRSAVRHQALYGWDLFLRGFLSTDFSTLMTTSSSTDPSPFTSILLQSFVLVWTELFSFWHSHLDAVHQEQSPSGGSAAFRAELVLQIRVCYDDRERVLAQDRLRLFPSDLEQFLTEASTATLSNYVRIYRPAIIRSCRQAIALSRHHTRPLTTYGFSCRRRTSTFRVARFPHKRTRWRHHPASVAASRQLTLPFLPT